MRKSYFEIIRDVLRYELPKDNKNMQVDSQIMEMKMEIDEDFPRQLNGDKKSCGFFMLQGVTDLMRYGTICFQKLSLPTVK